MKHKVKEEAVIRAAAMLKAAGAKYYINIDGNEETNDIDFIREQFVPAVEQPKRTRKPKRHLRFKYGYLSGKFKPFIKDLQPGDVAVVPYGDINPGIVQGTITAMANNSWGKGNYVSTMTSRGLEILRVA